MTTVCDHCGASFERKRSTARFCSTACRVAAHRKAKVTSKPQRFQVTTLLMKNPPNGKRVMRPSRWGNPFTIKAEGSAAAAVARFRQHLTDHPELVELGRRELRGFDLGCTCPLGEPCHADVWLDAVNG